MSSQASVRHFLHPVWHPERDELTLFVEGKLPEDRTSAISNHLLEGCSLCSRVLGSSTTATESAFDHSSAVEAVPAGVRQWVEQILRQPGTRAALILENATAPKPEQVARALLTIATTSSETSEPFDTSVPPPFLLKVGHTDSGARQSAAGTLLELAIDTLNGEGLAAGQQADDTIENARLRVMLVCSASKQLVAQGAPTKALVLLGGEWDRWQLPAAPDFAPSAANSLESGSDQLAVRARLLLQLAATLRSVLCQQDIEHSRNLPGLRITSIRSALAESQRLFAVLADQDGHLDSVIELSTALLVDEVEHGEPHDFSGLLDGLNMHANRLASGRHAAASPSAQELLVWVHRQLALQRIGALDEALDLGTRIAEQFEQRGDHSTALRIVLQQARILVDQGNTEQAMQCYDQAINGLVLDGQAVLAATSMVEKALLAIEADVQPSADFASNLAPLFAAGVFDQETTVALLLLREAIAEQRATPALATHCQQLLGRIGRTS